jgi:hypothetical protein
MVTKKLNKPDHFYICSICSYNTCNKYDYSKHLTTAKHKKKQMDVQEIMKLPNMVNVENILIKKNYAFKPHGCECGKTYKYNSGLYKHKRTCVVLNTNFVSEPIGSDVVVELLKQNQEFKELLVEQNKMILESQSRLLELSNKQMTITNSNNNNTTNNKFNLNFFLNEQCKNAINLPDFVNSLKLTLTDLERVGQLGYAEGISRIFVKGLKEMDVFKRPIHCSDIKRETLYVRDKDAWEKENEEKEKIKVAIRKIAHNNIKQITQWAEEKPEHKKTDTPEYNEWTQLVYQSVGGGKSEDQNYQKIIKNVVYATLIDKNEN